MDWDELESIMWQYYTSLPEPKISYTIWWYGTGGIKEMLQGYHVDKPQVNPLWARQGGDR